MGQRLESDARRTQLLELGLKLFSTRSYEDISIAEIAKDAQASAGLLYHYFGGKRDFYLAVIDMAAGQIMEAIAPQPGASGLDVARAGIIAYMDYVEARADGYLALLHGGLGADAQVLAIVERVREGFVAQILDGLGLSESRPIYRMAARSWLGAVEGASLEYLRHRAVAPEAVVELAIMQLVAAVRSAVRLDPEAEIDPALRAVFDGLVR